MGVSAWITLHCMPNYYTTRFFLCISARLNAIFNSFGTYITYDTLVHKWIYLEIAWKQNQEITDNVILGCTKLLDNLWFDASLWLIWTVKSNTFYSIWYEIIYNWPLTVYWIQEEKAVMHCIRQTIDIVPIWVNSTESWSDWC